MGSLLGVFLVVGLVTAPQPSTPAPCSAPEYRQFDFWIGDWVVFNPSGRKVGTSRIERIEQGCGILERWTNAGGVTGQSINVYRPTSKTWVQTWAGSDGLTLMLEGTFDAGKMILEGDSIGPRGERLRDRVTWSRLDGGKVRQFWEQSRDGGTMWTVSFDGTYARGAN
jgi:hypothetical protein